MLHGQWFLHGTDLQLACALFLNVDIFLGSDYFTENFQVKENKTKMRNIHPRFFQLLFQGSRLGFRLGFGLGFDLGIVLE